MRQSALAFAIGLVTLSSVAQAESVYTTLDTDACETLKTYEDGGVDLRCPGLDGIDVFVSDGDARLDVDYGVPSGAFESFSAFNNVGETIEWMVGADGVPYAAALRFLIRRRWPRGAGAGGFQNCQRRCARLRDRRRRCRRRPGQWRCPRPRRDGAPL